MRQYQVFTGSTGPISAVLAKLGTVLAKLGTATGSPAGDG